MKLRDLQGILESEKVIFVSTSLYYTYHISAINDMILRNILTCNVVRFLIKHVEHIAQESA